MRTAASGRLHCGDGNADKWQVRAVWVLKCAHSSRLCNGRYLCKGAVDYVLSWVYIITERAGRIRRLPAPATNTNSPEISKASDKPSGAFFVFGPSAPAARRSSLFTPGSHRPGSIRVLRSARLGNSELKHTPRLRCTSSVAPQLEGDHKHVFQHNFSAFCCGPLRCQRPQRVPRGDGLLQIDIAKKRSARLVRPAHH